MYFAIDMENKVVVNDNGDILTVEQFKKIVESHSAHGDFLDMTLSLQRFISCDYDFDALEAEYQNMA